MEKDKITEKLLKEFDKKLNMEYYGDICEVNYGYIEEDIKKVIEETSKAKDEELYRIVDEMIKEAWNDNNAFCRKLKEYLGRHFLNNPEIKERCKDPYWKDKKQKQEKIE